MFHTHIYLIIISHASVTFGYHRTLPTLTIVIFFSKLLKFSPKQIPRTNFCQRKKESYDFWHGELIKSLKFATFWGKKGSNHNIQTKCACKLSVWGGVSSSLSWNQIWLTPFCWGLPMHLPHEIEEKKKSWLWGCLSLPHPIYKHVSQTCFFHMQTLVPPLVLQGSLWRIIFSELLTII